MPFNFHIEIDQGLLYFQVSPSPHEGWYIVWSFITNNLEFEFYLNNPAGLSPKPFESFINDFIHSLIFPLPFHRVGINSDKQLEVKNLSFNQLLTLYYAVALFEKAQINEILYRQQYNFSPPARRAPHHCWTFHSTSMTPQLLKSEPAPQRLQPFINGGNQTIACLQPTPFKDHKHFPL